MKMFKYVKNTVCQEGDRSKPVLDKLPFVDASLAKQVEEAATDLQNKDHADEDTLLQAIAES